MDFHTLIGLDTPQLYPAPAPIELDFRPPREPAPRAWHEELGTEHGWADLGIFAQRLSAAGILTTHPGMLSGAQVVLPYGLRFIERLVSEISQVYEEYGLQPHEYATVVPISNISAVRDVLDLEEKVVYVGEKRDFRAGEPVAALCPSGEEVIYAHWKHIVRERRDLPIRMYRRASFFRPKRSSGQAVFRSLEARDVMEFHGCFASEDERIQGAEEALSMLRAVLDRVAVPAIFSTRPLWGNRNEVSLCTVGVDTPLPTGSTVQSGCLYHQAQLFSKVLGVGFRERGQVVHTHHLTGAVSRRLAFIHLLLGMSSDGGLLIHPRLAPDQVAVVFQASAADGSSGDEIVGALRALGLRVRYERISSGNRGGAGRLHARIQREGVPVRVLVQGKRSPDDHTRVVVGRADTREECVLTGAAVMQLPRSVPLLLEAVGQAYRHRASSFVSRQIVDGDGSVERVRELLQAHRVVRCPLLPSEEATRTIAGWRTGEVLGFQRGTQSQRCVISGEPTEYVAYCSARL